MNANNVFTGTSSSALMLMSFPSGRVSVHELECSGKLTQIGTNHIKQDIIVVVVVVVVIIIIIITLLLYTSTMVQRIKHITASYKCSLLPQQ
jgi:hypothetical protein